jgi:hypothetical protein
MFYNRLMPIAMLVSCGLEAAVTAKPSLPRARRDFNPRRQKFDGQKARKFCLRNGPLVLPFAPPIPALLVDH